MESVRPSVVKESPSNLYGAAAPGAPPVFLTDGEFSPQWKREKRYYLIGRSAGIQRIESIVGKSYFDTVAASGGKLLVTNHPVVSPNQKAERKYLPAGWGAGGQSKAAVFVRNLDAWRLGNFLCNLREP